MARWARRKRCMGKVWARDEELPRAKARAPLSPNLHMFTNPEWRLYYIVTVD